MAIQHHMIEEFIDGDGEEYFLKAHVEVSEDEPRFSVFYELNSGRRAELRLEVRFLIENPIGIDDIVIGGATYYGLCIAGKLTRKTAKEAIKCYRKSKRDNPDHGVLDHAKEAGACVAGKGGVLKDTAADALVDCIKLPKDDDEDGDDT